MTTTASRPTRAARRESRLMRETTIRGYRYPLLAIFLVAVGAGLLTVAAVVALVH